MSRWRSNWSRFASQSDRRHVAAWRAVRDEHDAAIVAELRAAADAIERAHGLELEGEAKRDPILCRGANRIRQEASYSMTRMAEAIEPVLRRAYREMTDIAALEKTFLRKLHRQHREDQWARALRGRARRRVLAKQRGEEYAKP